MALHARYTDISLHEQSNWVDHLRILLDVFALDEVQKMMGCEETKKDVWENTKKYKVMVTEKDLFCEILNCFTNNRGGFSQSIPSLLNYIIAYLPKKIKEDIENMTSLSEIAEIILQYYEDEMKPKTNPIITIIRKNQHMPNNTLVDPLLKIFDNADLTLQVNREPNTIFKGNILWNYAKFNYSHTSEGRVNLNDDVTSVIKSFIPLGTRIDQLRLRYTDEYLKKGLMTKTTTQLKNIEKNIFPYLMRLTKYFSIDMNYRLYISTKRSYIKKNEEVDCILEILNTAEKISKGHAYSLIRGSKKKCMNKSYRIIYYTEDIFNLFRILVCLCKTPSKKVCARKNTSN